MLKIEQKFGQRIANVKCLMRPNGGEMMVKIEEKFGQRIGNVLRACFEWGQIG